MPSTSDSTQVAAEFLLHGSGPSEFPPPLDLPGLGVQMHALTVFEGPGGCGKSQKMQAASRAAAEKLGTDRWDYWHLRNRGLGLGPSSAFQSRQVAEWLAGYSIPEDRLRQPTSALQACWASSVLVEVVSAALHGRPSVLTWEDPEQWLDSKATDRLARLLLRTAAAGCYVLVETRSSRIFHHAATVRRDVVTSIGSKEADPAKKRFPCAECGETCLDDYMVRPTTWAEVMPSTRGFLHLQCLEQRLRRPLHIEDFPEVPCNAMLRAGYRIGAGTRPPG